MAEKCPFKVDDWVVYRPSLRGRGLLVMTDLAKLVPDAVYRVVEIENAEYLVLKGFEKSLPRSLHWTEFKKADNAL
jgi:hypothetical protein